MYNILFFCSIRTIIIETIIRNKIIVSYVYRQNKVLIFKCKFNLCHLILRNNINFKKSFAFSLNFFQLIAISKYFKRYFFNLVGG